MRKPELYLFALLALFATGVAMADDDEPLDVTITVVQSPTDLPAAVTKTIQLPPTAAATAREHAQHGLDTANSARQSGRAFGQSIADQAKTKGAGRGNSGNNGRGNNGRGNNGNNGRGRGPP